MVDPTERFYFFGRKYRIKKKLHKLLKQIALWLWCLIPLAILLYFAVR